MLVADAQDVAEALGDQQRGRLPLALDQRVGDDGRGVDDHPVDLARREARGREHGVDAGEESFDEIVRAW